MRRRVDLKLAREHTFDGTGFISHVAVGNKNSPLISSDDQNTACVFPISVGRRQASHGRSLISPAVDPGR